jgi:hypothetical protein
MKKLYFSKFIELVLLVVVLFSMVGCAATPQAIQQAVEAGATVLKSPDANAYIIYGVLPNGKEVLAVVRQVGQAIPYLTIGQTNQGNEILQDAFKASWTSIDFRSLPNVVQLLLLTKVSEAVAAIKAAKDAVGGEIPVFLPAFFLHISPDGTSNPDCWNFGDVVSCKL